MNTSIAVDIGGTFVDAVAFDYDRDRLETSKASTTPENPANGVIAAIEKLDADVSDARLFVHGTTLGLNAVLEREGAETGLITNEGFEDVFEMGRYNRPDDKIYSLDFEEPDLLVPGRRRVGVQGRIDADGHEREPLDEAAVAEAAEYLVDERGVDTIAICLLHAYQNTAHEAAAGDTVRDQYPDVPVSVSNDITRRYREYERTSTTVMNAYIKPVVESYLDDLEAELTDRGFDGAFFVTRSGGGALRAADARSTPVHTLLSGPAGGLIGATGVGETIDRADLVAVDMGGTSTDACVIRDGSPTVKSEAYIEELPLLVPIYDIRTIGTGGGSIAWVDDDLLKVGPRSAGADPGPICYGQGGTEPTLTDAALALGYLEPESFLGGDISLVVEEALAGIREKLASPLDTSVESAAGGVFDVALGKAVGAIREITVENGLDPRDLPMVAYGGAGPMFVPLIARELGVNEVVVPRSPAVFSAYGMLQTDIVQDHVRTDIELLEDVTLAAIMDRFDAMESEADRELASAGFDPERRRFDRYIEIRYFGQEHTLEVACEPGDDRAEIRERFARRHERRYGHTMDDPIQLVHYHLKATGEVDTPPATRWESVGSPVPDHREAYCFAAGEFVDFRFFRRHRLPAGERVEGPAVIQEPTSTTVLQSDQEVGVDPHGNLVVGGGGQE